MWALTLYSQNKAQNCLSIHAHIFEKYVWRFTEYSINSQTLWFLRKSRLHQVHWKHDCAKLWCIRILKDYIYAIQTSSCWCHCDLKIRWYHVDAMEISCWLLLMYIYLYVYIFIRQCVRIYLFIYWFYTCNLVLMLWCRHQWNWNSKLWWQTLYFCQYKFKTFLIKFMSPTCCKAAVMISMTAI